MTSEKLSIGVIARHFFVEAISFFAYFKKIVPLFQIPPERDSKSGTVRRHIYISA